MTIARYFFKPNHIELVLGAAGLGCGVEISTPAGIASPTAVAALLERTARSMGAPLETEAEIRAEAEQEVAKIVAKVAASNQSGGLKQWNTAYKQYRRAQIAKAEKAIPYSAYLQRVIVATMVRNVAMTGRMV